MLPECVATGDHYWLGSTCAACGRRLRCDCGVYIRVENMNDHFNRCKVVQRAVREWEASQ